MSEAKPTRQTESLSLSRLLDVTATAEDLGETPGKDVRSRQATYPALYGIGTARVQLHDVCRRACEALGRTNRPSESLKTLADFVLERQK